MARGGIPRRLVRPVRRLGQEVRDGAANTKAVPLGRQIQAWRHGFYAKHSLLYDFDRFGFAAYVSDLERATRLEALNDPVQRYLLNDKLVTFLYLRALGAPTPEVYGYAHGEHAVLFEQHGQGDGLGRLLEAHPRLVVKPRGASGGVRFCLVELIDGTTSVNGRRVADIRECLGGSVVISQFVEQHAYASEVFPGATNTLRLLILRDRETREPFVAAGVQRFGTERSRPVDNVSKGGLTAGVDVETGVLGPLVAIPSRSKPRPVRWHDVHPDTGVRVSGSVVPHWGEVQAEVTRVMTSLEGSNCVGWDVVITPDGFSILEGNNRPDVNLHQVHAPLLMEERARKALQTNSL
jgi:hypothetical protein